MRTAAIVTAAGSGARLGEPVPKALVAVDGSPLVTQAARRLIQSGAVDQIVIAAPPEHLGDFAKALAPLSGFPLDLVPGGAHRQESVARALAAVPDDVDVVLVHDAARAFASPALIRKVAATVRAGHDAVVPAIPVTDTLKAVVPQAQGLEAVSATLDRDRVRVIQTPQGFDREVLARAHSGATGLATDDAGLVEALGGEVVAVLGEPLAMKITTPVDLTVLQALLRAPVVEAPASHRQGVEVSLGPEPGTQRIGVGVDAHTFAPASSPRPLWLAGLLWPEEPGLSGHSDADVVAHAAADALFSAAGLGDLGSNFGTAEPQWALASGVRLLAETVARVQDANWRIGNVAVQLVGNHPRFAPRRAEAEAALTDVVGAPVTISATTTDGMGFTGRGEGLAAIATALVVAGPAPTAGSANPNVAG